MILIYRNRAGYFLKGISYWLQYLALVSDNVNFKMVKGMGVLMQKILYVLLVIIVNDDSVSIINLRLLCVAWDQAND